MTLKKHLILVLTASLAHAGQTPSQIHSTPSQQEIGNLATHLMTCGYFNEYLDLEQLHQGDSDYERGKSEAIRFKTENTELNCRKALAGYQRLRSPASL